MFEPIGIVESNAIDKVDCDWGNVVSKIIINETLQSGLIGLDEFSHILVIFHLNESSFDIDNHLTRRPQGRNDMPKVGIFAQRAKDRPNALGVTAVQLLTISNNIIEVQGLDAINGTPVLDIKPYYPAFDCMNATVPQWVDTLMVNYF